MHDNKLGNSRCTKSFCKIINKFKNMKKKKEKLNCL